MFAQHLILATAFVWDHRLMPYLVWHDTSVPTSVTVAATRLICRWQPFQVHSKSCQQERAASNAARPVIGPAIVLHRHQSGLQERLHSLPPMAPLHLHDLQRKYSKPLHVC